MKCEPQSCNRVEHLEIDDTSEECLRAICPLQPSHEPCAMWAKFRGGRVTVIFDQIHEDDLEGAEGRAGGTQERLQKTFECPPGGCQRGRGPRSAESKEEVAPGRRHGSSECQRRPFRALEEIFYVEFAPCLSQSSLLGSPPLPSGSHEAAY